MSEISTTFFFPGSPRCQATIGRPSTECPITRCPITAGWASVVARAGRTSSAGSRATARPAAASRSASGRSRGRAHQLWVAKYQVNTSTPTSIPTWASTDNPGPSDHLSSVVPEACLPRLGSHRIRISRPTRAVSQ